MEHLIFSAKFRLKEGTSLDEIEDLAEATMARFNLSSLMHTTVGRPGQGGLSYFERQCLSIAVEIMAKPRILFLESPTADLDTTSALFIARSLKKLVNAKGITVCATLHEPRRDTLELFDSLMLLGLGGKLVYSGPVRKIGNYFKKLNYYLHEGEGMTDWLTDIATGRLAPPVKRSKRSKDKKGDSMHTTNSSTHSVKKVMFAIAGKVLETGSSDDPKERVASIKTKPFDNPNEQAKATCEMLCDHLHEYIRGLPDKKRCEYDPPEPYSLPRNRRRDFMYQLGCQLSRLLIIAERNWFTRFRDTTIIVVAVVLVTLMDGVARPTEGADMRVLNYENLAEPISAEALLLEFPSLFAFATSGIRDNITT